jgi:hypothetical protein
VIDGTIVTYCAQESFMKFVNILGDFWSLLLINLGDLWYLLHAKPNASSLITMGPPTLVPCKLTKQWQANFSCIVFRPSPKTSYNYKFSTTSNTLANFFIYVKLSQWCILPTMALRFNGRMLIILKPFKF